MKVSAISQDLPEKSQRRNLFIRLSNSFMSVPEGEKPIEKAVTTSPVDKPAKLGIENLQEFTIFPKQVVDGKTVIIA